MSEKTYVFIKKQHLNRFTIFKKIRIICLGGENKKMSDELIFLDSIDDIPKNKGKKGRDWEELFSKVENKPMVLAEKVYGSAPNIRKMVKEYNEKNNENLVATQRTVKDETIVYIYRKAE